MDEPAADQIQECIRQLQSEDQGVRESAAGVLCKLGSAAQPAIPALLNALLAEPGACPMIGGAIFWIGTGATHVEALRAGLRHPNTHVRFWAARGLVKCGPDAETAIPELIGALRDPHIPVGDSANWALNEIGKPAVLALCEAARNYEPSLRAVAVRSLGTHDADLEWRVPTVIGAFGDPDFNVRRSAWRATCALVQQLLGKRRGGDLTEIENQSAISLRAALDQVVADVAGAHANLDEKPALEFMHRWATRMIVRFDGEAN
jgi:HEAT repeat protein